MKVIQVVGYKKTGKTTVVAGLLKTLTEQGQRVAVIKHSHSDAVGVDPDSAVFSRSGAAVAIFTNDHEQIRHEPVQKLDQLISDLKRSCDCCIIEGWKSIVYPRIVCMSEDASSLLVGAFAVSGVAVAAKIPPSTGLPLYNALVKGDLEKLSDVCMQLPEYPAGLDCRHCGMTCRELYLAKTCGEDVACTVKESGNVVITVNGKKLDLSQFIENIAVTTITGFVSSLKGFENGDIEISIKNPGK